MTSTIDLNADIGEGYTSDASLLQIVTSCNIACGGHAGDESTMQAALYRALETGTHAGAHPSYPDQENFGRKTMAISDAGLAESVAEQIFRLSIVADGIGADLTHVKPHGALYHDAARDRDLAKIFIGAVRQVLPKAAIVGPPNSALEAAVKLSGTRYICEGFADRAYEPTGLLRPRSKEGAVIAEPERRIAQAIDLAKNKTVRTHKGEHIEMHVETICLHGDTTGAAASAIEIASALETAGIELKAAA